MVFFNDCSDNIELDTKEREQSSKALVCLLMLSVLTISTVNAGPREQAKRIHDRLAGVPASAPVIDEMASLIEGGDVQAAAFVAMDNPAFYNVTLKRWISPWTNEESDIFVPLNDYTATVIGMARDDMDFRQILSGDILYTADTRLGLPAYSNTNNAHYEALEQQNIDLQANLVANAQSSITGLPAEATAGVMTTRAAARSFFKDGTNRAMFRFTLINHLCTDLEGVKDISRVPDRIRQDVSRSPGGDSRIFINSCVGCHAGMDPLAQAYAYYEYEYDVESDPEGNNGFLAYNDIGETDPVTGTRVTEKHLINENNFPFGFIITDDSWDNYWRFGQNQNLGWDQSLSGGGSGAKSMGQELANSRAFAQCQVTKVFKNVCLRDPQDSADRAQVELMTNNFGTNNYHIRSVFADAANYCKGE